MAELGTAASLARTLADFAVSARATPLRQELMNDSALRLLDIVGLCLCVNKTPDAMRLANEIAEWGECGESSVIGFGTATAPVAALTNGILSHAEDFDDTHTRSLVHVSAAVVPAALAVAEEQQSSGAQLLAAISFGNETSIRIGLGAQGQFHSRGYHATSIVGPFGAAVAAGILMGLQAPVIAHALGIAASMASGVLEFLEDGATVKRIHPGWASHAGVTAARLARAGMTGPATALEGRFGLFRTHVGDAFDTEVVVSELGDKWHALDTSFKPYPCCNFLHAAIDAIAYLQREHCIHAGDVEALICGLPSGAIPVVAEPQRTRRHPRTGYDAKFSAFFSLASQLVHGRVGLDTFQTRRLTDTEILGLMSRIDCRPDPQFAAYPDSFGGSVEIRLRDGTMLSRTEPYNRGGPFRPMTLEDVFAKFLENARGALKKRAAEQLGNELLAVGSIKDVRLLSASMGDFSKAREATVP